MKTRHLRKLIFAAFCTMIVIISSCLSVNARNIYSYELTFIPMPYSDLYAVDGSGDYNPEIAYLSGACIVSSFFKEFGTMADLQHTIVQDSYGRYGLAFPRSEIDRMVSIHDQCQAWCAASVPLIVPDGTKAIDAVYMIANWVADNMTYDDAALTDPALLNYYQNALPGFQTGKGVCATYATMFNTMVSWLPIDMDTERVDYSRKNFFYIDTKYIQNENHGWSAVKTSDYGWSLFDLTFYDNSDGPRQPQYLMMPMSALDDGAHSDIISMFYIEHGSTMMLNGY